MRIQKFISAAGAASRREAEEMIQQGRVTVNGAVATIGQKVVPGTDKVMVDGEGVKLSTRRFYFLLNKPRGYVTTRSDERGRPTVLDLVKGVGRYLYPVGRLDFDSEGLLILTNDGELAHGLTHPRHHVPRTYRALVETALDDEQLKKLSGGLHLPDGPTGPIQVHLHRQSGEGAWYELVLHEGRNRQVRRMFQAVGSTVRRLVRIAMGPLRLTGLAAGAYRPLTREEIELLKESYADHAVPA